MRIIDPFGSRACEAELSALGKRYSDLYFYNTPFNESALNPETYLIIGRRGSGKTALAQYFSFQSKMPNALCIESRRGSVYLEVLSRVSIFASNSRAIAIPQLMQVWEYVIWSLIGREIEKDTSAHDSPLVDAEPLHTSERIAVLLRRFLDFFNERPESTMGATIEKFVAEANIPAIKRRAVKYASKRRIIVAIDTLEQYNVDDVPLMFAFAALVEYASEFNTSHTDQYIYLKVFVSGEVFPHMKEAVLLNLLKAVRHPVYLLWRPRDLLRLISWRLYRYLLDNNIVAASQLGVVNWEDDSDVLDRIWVPHFGRKMRNSRGFEEQTWPYILRHTQMRPRQLIMICNEIAKRAVEAGTFPQFENDQIVEGVRAAEMELSGEIINSFSDIYPNATRIVDSLSGLDMVFEGKELDRRAPESAPFWHGDYSPARFRQLAAELGIIGIVDRSNPRSGFIDADFEYAMNDRLAISHRDTCVVHPMFYRKLRIVMNTDARVIPFTTERSRL